MLKFRRELCVLQDIFFESVVLFVSSMSRMSFNLFLRLINIPINYFEFLIWKKNIIFRNMFNPYFYTTSTILRSISPGALYVIDDLRVVFSHFVFFDYCIRIYQPVEFPFWIVSLFGKHGPVLAYSMTIKQRLVDIKHKFCKLLVTVYLTLLTASCISLTYANIQVSFTLYMFEISAAWRKHLFPSF